MAYEGEGLDADVAAGVATGRVEADVLPPPREGLPEEEEEGASLENDEVTTFSFVILSSMRSDNEKTIAKVGGVALKRVASLTRRRNSRSRH